MKNEHKQIIQDLDRHCQGELDEWQEKFLCSLYTQIDSEPPYWLTKAQSNKLYQLEAIYL